MALPAILAIISAIGAANSQGGGSQQPITQEQGYAGMDQPQQPPHPQSLGSLQGIGNPTVQQPARASGGGAMNTVDTIGNIAGAVGSLQGNQQPNQPYQMPYLRRR